MEGNVNNGKILRTMKEKISVPQSDFTAKNFLAIHGFNQLSPLLISAVEAFAKLKADMEVKSLVPQDDMTKFERCEKFKDNENKYVNAARAMEGPAEIYTNNLYQVEVRRKQPVNDDSITVAHLSIKRHDKKPIIDWRHFQWIKNELVGPENEGCELFPAEKRLVDGANQYHLWVFEQTDLKFPFGFNERLVSEASIFGGTQRKFPKNRRPSDIAECEKKAREAADKILSESTETQKTQQS
jgi:hypothetical protein